MPSRLNHLSLLAWSVKLRGFQPGAKASRALPVLACLPAPVGGKPWQEAQAASARLQGVLAAALAALAALGLLLALAALAQTAVVLAPLQDLQRALVQVREGRGSAAARAFPQRGAALH